MNKTKKTTLLVTLFSLAIVTILLGCGSGSTEEPTKVGEVGKTEETTTPKPVEKFKVGDVVQTKNQKITFISASEYTSDNMFSQPNEGNIYYRVEFEFENLSDSDQYVSTADFQGYADGYSVDSTWLEDDILSSTISQGKKAKGAIYYEIPSNTTTFELEYQENMFINEKIIFIVK